MIGEMPRKLNIPASFFRAEERNGFFVEEKMKRAWATQLQVLSMIGEICDLHGIRWWADFGTLLGAVRHRSYIPWDDDIDICVPRADYNRLMQIMPLELPPFCKVWCSLLDPHYTQLSSFVANRENIDAGNDEREAEITAYYFDCPYVVGVDVYPLDFVPADEGQFLMWNELLAAVYFAANGYDSALARGDLEERIVNIEAAAGVDLPRGEESRYALWQLAGQLSMIWQREEAAGWFWVPEMLTCSPDRVRPLAAYDRTVRIPYEFLEIPVPAGYEQILDLRFGQWTMARQETGAHDYPFYKKQDAYIEKCRG